jgi:hypothetical protein
MGSHAIDGILADQVDKVSQRIFRSRMMRGRDEAACARGRSPGMPTSSE